MSVDAVRAIFDREIAAAEADYETSTFVSWLSDVRDEVLAALDCAKAHLQETA